MSRECGDCSACCTVLGVIEIDKSAFDPCCHLGSEGIGCGVYGNRPDSCATYECLWLSGLLPKETDRPDKIGVVFSSTQSHVLGRYIQAAEVFPGGAKTERAREIIDVLGCDHAVLRMQADGRRVLTRAPDDVYDRVIDVAMDQLARKRAREGKDS